ncbi:MAG: DbpA RNA binding domain-containing protein [Treponema sp.]|nr:DbpA RNA binding domain-containing protein [Treponema sp.]
MDREKAKRNLEAILEKIHTETDISQLHEYQKMYKKEISLFKRSWAAAWLFMYYDQRETPRAEKIIKNKNEKTKPAAEKHPGDISLSEDESKRLFVSIGKNRKLFPREVITLIMSKTSAAREDIGLIRILDNYSFVQVRSSKADEIIESLGGIRFRGRTLTVNYAKPKTGENDENN